MSNFNYALDVKKYTWKNALLWGNFTGHVKKAQTGSLGRRAVHLLIALIELPPIIGQIASIFEKLIVCAFSTKPKPVNIELKPLVPKQASPPAPTLDSLCKEFHVRKAGSDERFRLHLENHQKLWEGSSLYREMIESIEKRKGQPVTIIDRNAAIQLSQSQGKDVTWLSKFEFRACWCEELNAVVFFDPDSHLDGTTLAFEMTNGYQQVKFDDVHSKAISGGFIDRSVRNEAVRLERAANAYAHAMEAIENNGRTLHEKLIDEAIASGKVTADWHWHDGRPQPPAARLVNDLILSEYGQKHIAYYEKAYKDGIAPHIKPQNVAERMKSLATARA